MNYGIQLYSLRDTAADDFAGTISTVAKIGYTSVEPAGFFGHSAKEVARLIADNGLTLTSTHTPIKDLTPDNLSQTIRYHKELGNPRIIIPSSDLSSPAKLEDLIDFINDVQPKLAAEGIILGYHNHAYEFRINSWGIRSHTEIERRTKIEFQIDTYWAFVAGLDPVEVITRLQDRITLIHLKDGDPNGHGCALGEGQAPVAAVREAAIRLGLGMVVESEGCNPTGAEEVARCMDYLRALTAK